MLTMIIVQLLYELFGSNTHQIANISLQSTLVNSRRNLSKENLSYWPKLNFCFCKVNFVIILCTTVP